VITRLYMSRRVLVFFFSSRRRHTRFSRDWSSDVCSSDLAGSVPGLDVPQVITDVDTACRIHTHLGAGLEQGLGVRLATADLIGAHQAGAAPGQTHRFEQRDAEPAHLVGYHAPGQL